MAYYDRMSIFMIENQGESSQGVNATLVQPGVETKKSGFWLFFLSITLILLVLIGVGLYLAIKQSNKQLLPSSVPQIQPSQPPQESDQKINPASLLSDLNITIETFRIFIPKDWSVSISTKTDKVLAARFYPDSTSAETTYLEVQAGPTDQFSANATISFESEQTASPNKYIRREGKETLMQSRRKVLQLEKVTGGSTLLLTLYGLDQDIDKFVPAVTQIMENSVPKQSLRWARQALAQTQENSSSEVSGQTTINGFPIADWKTIHIMEGPYPERVTSADHKYKDGFVKLYKFSHLRGQRLEILAEESKEDVKNIGSFIEQELYDQQGLLILKGQTRLSLPASFAQSDTADYYLLVKSFSGKEGRFLLKVFDLDQVNDLYSLRYADGSEIQLDGQQKSKNQPAVLIVRLTSPVEIVGSNTFRYFKKPDNGCIVCGNSSFYGDKSVPITIRTSEGTIPLKITKIFLNQMIIQPNSQESFDAGKNYSFDLDYGEDPNVPGARNGYNGSFRTF